jgi:hypothetical protein
VISHLGFLFFVVVVGSPFESKLRWNVAWMLLYKIYILNVLLRKFDIATIT